MKTPKEIAAEAHELWLSRSDITHKDAVDVILAIEELKLKAKAVEDQKNFMDQVAHTLDEIRIMGIKVRS